MSARADLVAALGVALPPETYRVVGSPSCPDQIDANTFAVRAWTSRMAPGPQSGSLQIDMTVWVLTPGQTPGSTDDALDVACQDVLEALYVLAWLTPPTAERAVMEDDDGPRWHGWRFECSGFGQITLEE